ncbi:PocR ligand-binding domain-containing protein [Intestinibacter sp.]
MENINYLDQEYMEKLLTNFSKATGLFIEAVDIYGKTFLTPKDVSMCEFCSYIRSNEEGVKKCEKSYQKACKEAFRWKTTYFFRCHAGLVMWSVPIIADNENIGCIICGQVLLWEADEFFLEELKESNQDLFDFDIICEKVKQLDVISAEKCQSAAEMLLLVVNYIVRTNNNIFLEQRNRQYWRNQIIKEIEERKKGNIDKIFDYDTYFKREKKLLQYVRVGNKEKIINFLPIIFTDIDVLSEYNTQKIKLRATELVVNMSRAIVEGGLDSKLSIDKAEHFYKKVEGCKTSEDVFSYLNKFILELVDDIFILTQNKQVSLLKEARAFISNNYDQNITIEDVAESVCLSSSYLSHLFREKLNCTVNNYITRVRIEKSIELMSMRELSVQEISEKVGFNSQSYFTKIFKKYIGVTPITYRNKFK